MGKLGRPRKPVDEKRKRKTDTQRHRREGERMAREHDEALNSSTLWNVSIAADSARQREVTDGPERK
jgi:hypothetical protein